MANRYRGEIEAELDGRKWTLCLTLGGLAELETAFEAGDLGQLVAKLGAGSLTAQQMSAVLAAGLRGGGHVISNQEAAELRSPGGLPGLVGTVSQLLAATFQRPPGTGRAPERQTPNPSPPQDMIPPNLGRLGGMICMYLRKMPAQFWSMPFGDLMLLAEILAPLPGAPPRRTLDAFMARFPDLDQRNLRP